jgi:hypothetical protein
LLARQPPKATCRAEESPPQLMSSAARGTSPMAQLITDLLRGR